jgi:hypothetical protein
LRRYGSLRDTIKINVPVVPLYFLLNIPEHLSFCGEIVKQIIHREISLKYQDNTQVTRMEEQSDRDMENASRDE